MDADQLRQIIETVRMVARSFGGPAAQNKIVRATTCFEELTSRGQREHLEYYESNNLLGACPEYMCRSQYGHVFCPVEIYLQPGRRQLATLLTALHEATHAVTKCGHQRLFRIVFVTSRLLLFSSSDGESELAHALIRKLVQRYAGERPMNLRTSAMNKSIAAEHREVMATLKRLRQHNTFAPLTKAA